MRRLLLKAIVLCAFLVMPLWLAALAFDQLNRNQETYRYIADALDPLTLAQSNVDWQPATTPIARPLTLADETRVGLALTEAWQALAAAQVSGDTDILKDRFTGVARARAEQSTLDAQAFGGRISVLRQAARPVFYHKDGSMLQLELDMLVARYVRDAAGLVHHQISDDVATVTLFNHTTGWRIFSYEREASSEVTPTVQPAKLPDLRGVNYYPAASPWLDFWEQFDDQVIAADFDRVLNLNANAVRIFLPYQDFAVTDRQEASLEKLRVLLQIAQDKGIWVIPTLFDFKPSFGPGSWTNDIRYLDAVLPVLQQSDAVAFVDLKNEADLDYAAHGRGQIQAWLRSMVTASALIAPDLPMTIGWSSADHAGELTDVLGVISYHDFGSVGAVRANLTSAQTTAAGKPVIVTEIGASSFNMALGLPGSQGKQADILRKKISDLQGAGGVFVWTLYDFDHIDGGVVGGTPWRKWLQAEFGLFQSDGSEKDAARAVRQGFDSRAP